MTRKFGWAWLGLCSAFAVHVADEALTNFLAVYNPTVLAIRAHFPYLPLPTFRFEVWILSLVLAVVILSALSLWAFRGARWITLLSYPFGIIMLLNGTGHLLGSAYRRRLVAGVYSAPLLLAGSLYLLISVRRLRNAQSAVTKSPSGGT